MKDSWLPVVRPVGRVAVMGTGPQGLFGWDGDRPRPPLVASHHHQQEQATQRSGRQHHDRPKRRAGVEVVHPPQRRAGSPGGSAIVHLHVDGGTSIC
jgi:hypothetical protein